MDLNSENYLVSSTAEGLLKKGLVYFVELFSEKPKGIINHKPKKYYNFYKKSLKRSELRYVYYITSGDVDLQGAPKYPFLAGIEVLKRLNILDKFIFINSEHSILSQWNGLEYLKPQFK